MCPCHVSLPWCFVSPNSSTMTLGFGFSSTVFYRIFQSLRRILAAVIIVSICFVNDAECMFSSIQSLINLIQKMKHSCTLIVVYDMTRPFHKPRIHKSAGHETIFQMRIPIRSAHGSEKPVRSVSSHMTSLGYRLL